MLLWKRVVFAPFQLTIYIAACMMRMMLEYMALNKRGLNCLRGVFENFFSLNKILYESISEFQLVKNLSTRQQSTRKQSVVSAKQSIVYTSKAITTEFKGV